MRADPPGTGDEILDDQQRHWQDSFARKPEMFGAEPSDPARKALELFKREKILKLLELGGGQGRDSIFFAQNGFQVSVLDSAESGVKDIAPSFLVVIGVVPYFDKLRNSIYFNRVIRGVSCSFVGLLCTVTFRFASDIPWDVPRFSLAVAALVTLILKVEVFWILLAGSMVSIFLIS